MGFPLCIPVPGWAAANVEFNTDVLDARDRATVDLSEFARAGYIMPGRYPMALRLNNQDLAEQTVTFLPPPSDPKGSEACLTPKMVNLLGLKASIKRQLTWWHQGQCLNLTSLKGSQARGDLGSGTLSLSVPQAYLEYVADDWDPPSRWDNGIPGVLFDYNLNALNTRQAQGRDSQSLSGNGTAGMNLGAWRLRADWQGQYDHTTGKANSTQQQWDWNRFYMYRAVAALRARLMLGENYLDSSLFDSFRFTGASLVSDDNMLPPNLRGYAPEVTGVAKTNAKVTISQQGRVLYETQVPAGPFLIQDLNAATTGTLDVKVTEQDGSVRTFQVNTGNVPYLTRPGLVRYTLSAGKPSTYRHEGKGPNFAAGEFSWGVNNGWSLYGGSLLAGEYNALSMGVGRDLLALGALSLDATQSRADLPMQGTRQGSSWRLSYSKRFDQYDSQVTFAGYRFSQRSFMSLPQYLDTRYRGQNVNNNKAQYTLSLSKQFTSLGVSAYVNYSHQTYWTRPPADNYSLSLSRYFDMGVFNNVSLNLSAYRTVFNNRRDDGMYMNITVPWGTAGSLSYNTQYARGGSSHSVGYYRRIDDNNAYSLSAGVGTQGTTTGSGYFTHDGDSAQIIANGSMQEGQYSSIGLSAQGGMTATAKGAALHRVNTLGGTRMMVDTDGVSGVPIRGYGGITRTNAFGKAVISDINSYYRNTVKIDVNHLADNVDALRSVVQGTLTQGAIGYRKFSVMAGEKAMATLRLPDGSAPPFGATVFNRNHIQTGIVNDDGSVWLTGIRAGESMAVRWHGRVQCQIHIPASLPATLTSNLLLPCRAQEAAVKSQSHFLNNREHKVKTTE
nr:outer membrane usher protein [Serratia marcescens]